MVILPPRISKNLWDYASSVAFQLKLTAAMNAMRQAGSRHANIPVDIIYKNITTDIKVKEWSRDRPKFGFGFSAESGQNCIFGLLSVSAKVQTNFRGIFGFGRKQKFNFGLLSVSAKSHVDFRSPAEGLFMYFYRNSHPKCKLIKTILSLCLVLFSCECRSTSRRFDTCQIKN